MAKGGARNRSGPAPDPNSATSERRKYVLTALPVEGYSGSVPRFPLSPARVSNDEGVLDKNATARHRRREAALWAQVWEYPQACAWSMEPWRWHTIAMWVRTAVICESEVATAADKNSLHRFADQIGLTPAGLRENGWKIADKPVVLEAVPAAAPVQPRRSRSMSA